MQPFDFRHNHLPHQQQSPILEVTVGDEYIYQEESTLVSFNKPFVDLGYLHVMQVISKSLHDLLLGSSRKGTGEIIYI